METARIPPREVQERLNQREMITFLDVRNPDAWKSSDKQIPRAFRARSVEDVRKALDGLPEEQMLVAYCT